jgi:hypothetical protein
LHCVQNKAAEGILLVNFDKQLLQTIDEVRGSLWHCALVSALKFVNE